MLALACLRLGYPTRHAKGADELSHDVTAPFEDALVRSLDDEELRRALAVAVDAYRDELQRTDPDAALRIGPMLAELAA